MKDDDAAVNDTIKTLIALMRDIRDETMDGCIELCDALAEGGHNAACCARALRDLKDKLQPRS
jgi:hypothetical protein